MSKRKPYRPKIDPAYRDSQNGLPQSYAAPKGQDDNLPVFDPFTSKVMFGPGSQPPPQKSIHGMVKFGNPTNAKLTLHVIPDEGWQQFIEYVQNHGGIPDCNFVPVNVPLDQYETLPPEVQPVVVQPSRWMEALKEGYQRIREKQNAE